MSMAYVHTVLMTLTAPACSKKITYYIFAGADNHAILAKTTLPVQVLGASQLRFIDS